MGNMIGYVMAGLFGVLPGVVGFLLLGLLFVAAMYFAYELLKGDEPSLEERQQPSLSRRK